MRFTSGSSPRAGDADRTCLIDGVRVVPFQDMTPGAFHRLAVTKIRPGLGESGRFGWGAPAVRSYQHVLSARHVTLCTVVGL